MSQKNYILAFDTANEIIAVGVGKLERETATIKVLASCETPAFRASNTKLIAKIDAALEDAGVAKSELACVACGRGPGSFTGVRICTATAKGIALGLDLPLFGVSTLDAQAWDQWAKGVRGEVVVLGDAMRKEVYPVRYVLNDEGPVRQNADFVIKAEAAKEWLAASAECQTITGDALGKFAELFAPFGTLAPESDWHPTGAGLLRCVEAAWRDGAFDPDDRALGNPLALLPVYTRLSDAEEHERIKLAKMPEGAERAQELRVGVADPKEGCCASGSAESGHEDDQSSSVLPAGFEVRFVPLDASWAGEVEALEARVMGSDAWNAAQIIDDLPRSDRTWWAAFLTSDAAKRTVEHGSDALIGYAGGWIVDGGVQILKVATDPRYRRLGIARSLIEQIALDARDLGAHEMSLEVRITNTGAHRFYEELGLKNIGVRPRYYSDREDAVIYEGPLPLPHHDVAGMDLMINDIARAHEGVPSSETLIFAIETSCDETAAAIINGEGEIIADVVASQIDFHARFGGVVPEIASRKHIEAIAGVALECLEQARETLQNPNLTWKDLSAVAATYAPGLVGALVVGLAFAKGLAWSCDLPLVGVNHLEGHIYANKLACPEIEPPMVVSLVSGGHTMLVEVKDWGEYTTLGQTLDDAVGEAFDKVAKALGLGYPGGPLISKLAEKGDPRAIKFPRAMLHSGDYTFSLSGLKTAVLTYLQKEQQAGREWNMPDIAASFQQAVIDVQIAKARAALEQTGAREFCLGGGVAANPKLREAYEDLCDELGVRLTMPPLKACTDNASMIALVALERYQADKFFDFDCDVAAHVSLDDPY